MLHVEAQQELILSISILCQGNSGTYFKSRGNAVSFLRIQGGIVLPTIVGMPLPRASSHEMA
jgi:hypothetical protein